MSDLLGIGAQAVSVYRGALATIGDNVANANTDGYSRRDVRLIESSALGGRDPLSNNLVTGGGVRISGIDRAWDAFRAADARQARADAGRSETALPWLSAGETALDDGDYGVGQRLTAFFTAADALAADPAGTAPRRAMIAALGDVTNAFNRSAAGLGEVAAGVTDAATDMVNGINDDLHALAETNRAIGRGPPGSNARAQMEDQRDRLLDSLSSRMSIDVTLDERGAASVRANGPGGPDLLEHATPTFVDLAVAADGQISLRVSARDGTVALGTTGGAIAGLTDASRTIADQRRALDTIANDFSTQLAAWSAGGVDADGNAAPSPLSGSGAAGIAVAISDPGAIAAGLAGGPANGNLLRLGALRDDSGAEARHATLITGSAQQIASTKTQAAALGVRRDNALSALDAVSGVDLDREAAELLRYQQAYEGSARIIQVARETLQSIFNIF